MCYFPFELCCFLYFAVCVLSSGRDVGFVAKPLHIHAVSGPLNFVRRGPTVFFAHVVQKHESGKEWGLAIFSSAKASYALVRLCIVFRAYAIA